MTPALEQAVARLEKACRLSQSRYEEEVPLTANVPDALLIDVLAVLANTRTHGEASEVELREALKHCRVYFQHATAQNTRAILAQIDAALSDRSKQERLEP